MPNANNLGAGTYRYGMNGMERDNEVKGSGNSYTSYFRQYDPRLGRWLSIDPKQEEMPAWSPYSSFFDNPIYYMDEEGDIPYPVALKWMKKFVWGAQLTGDPLEQEYGWRSKKGRMHYGVDFNVGSGSSDEGIALLNLADGVVLDAGSVSNGGNYVVIKHGNGYITKFFHMQELSHLKAGDYVKEGATVGKIGGTYGYTPHGHIEMSKIPSSNVSTKLALSQFNSKDYHFNPRDIIGAGKKGSGGDLQPIANGYISGFNANPTFDQLVNGQVFIMSIAKPISASFSSTSSQWLTPMDMGRMTTPMQTVTPKGPPNLSGTPAVKGAEALSTGSYPVPKVQAPAAPKTTKIKIKLD